MADLDRLPFNSRDAARFATTREHHDQVVANMRANAEQQIEDLRQLALPMAIDFITAGALDDALEVMVALTHEQAAIEAAVPRPRHLHLVTTEVTA